MKHDRKWWSFSVINDIKSAGEMSQQFQHKPWKEDTKQIENRLEIILTFQKSTIEQT